MSHICKNCEITAKLEKQLFAMTELVSAAYAAGEADSSSWLATEDSALKRIQKSKQEILGGTDE